MDDTAPGKGPVQEVIAGVIARRTFDTPHFRGIEFIEVEAKSILNHVSGGYLPFNWTLNPYRGCTHACSYCLGGETPILMGDGHTRALAEVRTGDLVYGTVRAGSQRRYEVTPVLDHWSTVRPAYRVTLQDGTSLIASGDHRLLSDEGWKHVTGAREGPLARAHLIIDDTLVGTGRFADDPKPSPDYKRGYLCGLVRGGGSPASHSGGRGGRIARAPRGMVARADIEALNRAQDYLVDFGVGARELRLAAGPRKTMAVLLAARRGTRQTVLRIIEWPGAPSSGWCKGFLAGIFDASGGRSSGALRIPTADQIVVERIRACLRDLGFDFVVEANESGAGKAAAHCVRLRGGVGQRLRFWHTVDPAVMRTQSIAGAAIESCARLRVETIEPLGMEVPMFDITTGTGDFIADGMVSHNCFARVTHTYMDMNAGRDFESKIVVKVNAPELLRKELRARRWQGDPVAMGTATDPYQRAEGRYKLMPRIIDILAEQRNPFSILTKGTLILRDLDKLVAASEVAEVSAAFSIGTLDEDVWRRSEPGTPHPKKRIEAVARLNAAGIPCGVMMAPVLPGISDSEHQLRAVVEAAIDAGATHVSPILLHLRHGIKEVYTQWLADNYPDLMPRYRDMYQSAYAAPNERKALSGRVNRLVDARGGIKDKRRPRDVRGADRARRARASLDGEQLKLL